MSTVFLSIETRAQIGQKLAVSNIALDKKLSVLGQKLVSNLGGGSFQVLEVSQIFVGTASSIGAVASVAFSIVEVSIVAVSIAAEESVLRKKLVSNLSGGSRPKQLLLTAAY